MLVHIADIKGKYKMIKLHIVYSYPHQIHIFIFPISNKLQISLYNLAIILIKGILTLQSSITRGLCPVQSHSVRDEIILIKTFPARNGKVNLFSNWGHYTSFYLSPLRNSVKRQIRFLLQYFTNNHHVFFRFHVLYLVNGAFIKILLSTY